MKIQVGSKIKFIDEKQRYTVQASNERFAVCTKPFNVQKTVIYTIIDFERNVRGRENLIFCMGFETKEQCEEALERLVSGDSEVSYRHWQELNIEKIFPPPAPRW
jgi:hypothetical protein